MVRFWGALAEGGGALAMCGGRGHLKREEGGAAWACLLTGELCSGRMLLLMLVVLEILYFYSRRGYHTLRLFQVLLGLLCLLLMILAKVLLELLICYRFGHVFLLLGKLLGHFTFKSR